MKSFLCVCALIFTLLIRLCALVKEVFAILGELLKRDNNSFDRLHFFLFFSFPLRGFLT